MKEDTIVPLEFTVIQYKYHENDLYCEVTFNVPSREAIYKRMMQQAYGDSWQYDYEKFVEYDAINRNSTPQLLRSTADAPKEDRLQYYPMVIIHEQ